MTRPMRPGSKPQDSTAPFVCVHCRRAVPGLAPGTANRNHCPQCLFSLHVDLRTGDRSSGCRGFMEPIAIAVRYNQEWALIHRCKKCGLMRSNRISGDDSEIALLSLAVKPLALPPFPLETLGLEPNTQESEHGKEETNDTSRFRME